MSARGLAWNEPGWLDTLGAWLLALLWFAPLAYLFAALCLATCLSRILLAWRVFGVDGRAN